MTHEPMNTAPRDGREVWLMLKNQNRMELRSWDEDRKQWRNYDLEYSDCYFSGWLDIDALVRDAALFQRIAKYPYSAAELLINMLGQRDKPFTADALRAAIDKEMDRG